MGLGRSPPSGGRSRGVALEAGKQASSLGKTSSVAKDLLDNVVNDDMCGGCGKAVKENQNGIQCDVCILWYHSDCGGLKKKDNDYFNGRAESLWVCGKCKKVVRGAGEKIRN